MTYTECDACDGNGVWQGAVPGHDIVCGDCAGEGCEDWGEVEVWKDPVRAMIAHDGSYLCGDCAQGTPPGAVIGLVDSVFNDRTRAWSPVFDIVHDFTEKTDFTEET